MTTPSRRRSVCWSLSLSAGNWGLVTVDGMVTLENPFHLAERSAGELLSRAGIESLDVGVVLGTGWAEGAQKAFSVDKVIPTSSLPGFVTPGVAGHEGELWVSTVQGRRVGMLRGRVHLYEGHSIHAVVHGVRTLVLAGAKMIVLTNACGGAQGRYEVGEVVLMRDHLNLTGASPLEGDSPPEGYKSRFVDLGDLYDARTRRVVRELVPGIKEGVYAGFRGPHFETPGEIAMAEVMGADLVGMSTVNEAIAVKHLEARVVGLSLVTDLVGGAVSVSHEEVLAAATSAKGRAGAVLATVVGEA